MKRASTSFDNRCERVSLALFEEDHDFANGSVYTSVLEVMKQAAVKALLNGEAEDLLDGEMYRLDESHDFIKGLAHYLHNITHVYSADSPLRNITSRKGCHY